MPALASFKLCVENNLKAANASKQKRQRFENRFDTLVRSYEADGVPEAQANLNAQTKVLDEYTAEVNARTIRAQKLLNIQAENTKHIKQGLYIKTGFLGLRGPGSSLVRAAASIIEHNPLFRGFSYVQMKLALAGKYVALLDDALAHFHKGLGGRQIGAAHLDNVVREMKGEVTGDAAAKALADNFKKVKRTQADDWVREGGVPANIRDLELPQRATSARVIATPKQQFKDDYNGWLDWARMRWPNDELIDPADRDALLDEIYEVFRTDGDININPNSFRGMGQGVNDLLNGGYLLKFKNADAYLAMHAKYIDGNIYDNMISDIMEQSHRNAMMYKFGQSPELARRNIHAIVINEAAKLGVQDRAEDLFSKTFDPMFDAINRANSVSPNNKWAVGAGMTSDTLTAAFLGGAIIPSMFGDFMQTMLHAISNRLSARGMIAQYFKNMTPGSDMRLIGAQMGHVADSYIQGNYASQRLTGLATHGPWITRTISGAVMQLSGINRHTDVARIGPVFEMSGLMYRERGMKFADTTLRPLMEKYGITPAMWDEFRQMVPWNPKNNVFYMRPLDILKSNIPDKDKIFTAFQILLQTESRLAVPASTIEGQVFLKGNTRPRDLPGFILHSFSMFKNFPVTFALTYGRMAMAHTTARGRIGFAAALGLSTIVMGAMVTQMREVLKGREPLPMDARFWGRAILNGGAFGIWGDFLFSGVNDYMNSPAEAVGGPFAALVGDVTNLAFTVPFGFAEAMDKGEEFETTIGAKAGQFLERYTPGTSLWWARLALERGVWDQLQGFLDPEHDAKTRRMIRQRRRDYGQEYIWAPN